MPVTIIADINAPHRKGLLLAFLDAVELVFRKGCSINLYINKPSKIDARKITPISILLRGEFL